MTERVTNERQDWMPQAFGDYVGCAERFGEVDEARQETCGDIDRTLDPAWAHMLLAAFDNAVELLRACQAERDSASAEVERVDGAWGNRLRAIMAGVCDEIADLPTHHGGEDVAENAVLIVQKWIGRSLAHSVLADATDPGVVGLRDDLDSARRDASGFSAALDTLSRENARLSAEVERLRAERRELCERVGRSVMAMYEERASYGERVYDEDVAEIARVLDEEGA